MRIALIADIHGNLLALEAVLAEIAREQVDQIVSLGDVGAFGVEPARVIRRLRDIGCRSVMGNNDEYLLQPAAFAPITELGQRLRVMFEWNSKQLAPADLDFLKTFQPTLELPLDGDRRLLCYHGSPSSNNDNILSTTPDAELAPMLAGQTASLLAGGHTHRQMLRRYQDQWILNPGSVGMPLKQAASARRPAWAEYALIESTGNRVNQEFRRVRFDLEQLIQTVRSSDMPGKEWWLSEWTG